MRRIVCMIALLFVYLPLTADAQDHLDNHSDNFWIAAEEQILATLGYPTGGLLADPAVAHGIEVPRLFTDKHSIAIAAGKYTRGLAETFGIPEEVSDEQLITTMENTLLIAVYHRDKMNYDRIARSLVNLHKSHDNPEVKDMALGVLQLIGDNRGLAYVRDVASEDERNHCRHLAVGVVGDYFAAQPVIAGQ